MIGKSDIKVLVSEIEWTQKVCEQLAAHINEKVSIINKKNYDYVYLEALAINIMHFYSAVESLFNKIAKKVDESPVTGDSSHKELLKRMLVEIDGVRCAVLSKNSFDLIDKFRSFRHKSYHDFSITYKWEEMKDLSNSTKQALKLFNRDMDNFKDFLRSIMS